MMVLATAVDEAGKTTGVFIVSSPLKTQAEELPILTTTNLTTVPVAIIQQYESKERVALQQASELRERRTGTRRGILKPPKEICLEALAVLPSPIQRSTRLSPRELRRLTPLPPPLSSTKPHKEPKIKFSDHVAVLDMHASTEYNRGSCEFVARTLTPALALAIKRELNELKSEMEVHEESRHNTQFYKVC